jgi:hypothetical protein
MLAKRVAGQEGDVNGEDRERLETAATDALRGLRPG